MSAIGRVRRFWEAHVNNEYYTRQARGSAGYFSEIEHRRYRHHYHLVDAFARLAEVETSGKRLLEVGCGIGIDARRLSALGFDKIVGVDLTVSALAVARGRSLQEPFRGVDLACANAEGLPFDDGAFDVVYSFGVIHHTPEVAHAAREIERVLAPGGKALVMVYHARSLVNLVHQLLRLPYESPRDLRDHCPVVHRLTRSDARRLFDRFATVEVRAAYPFTWGMRWVSWLVPRPVERLLGRVCGWHLMIEATKRIA